MKIGIYGGTFNPPPSGASGGGPDGAGRAEAGQADLDACGGAAPTRCCRKTAPPRSTGWPWWSGWRTPWSAPALWEVSTLELEREGKSYTSDTLEAIHRQYPEAELWLLMGTDMFLTPALVARAGDHPAPGRDLRLRAVGTGRRGRFCPQREF